MNRSRYIYNCILAGILTASVALSGCGSASYVNGTEGQGAAQSADAGEALPEGSTGQLPGSDGGAKSTETPSADTASDTQATAPQTADQSAASGGQGTRDNTPVVLVPTQPGTVVYGNDLVSIDASNAGDGYISVTYFGTSPKVKMQITCPNTVTYTYNLTGGCEVFPLTTDSGTYSIGVFEVISGTEYSTCFRTDIEATVTNEFGAYLYPNQYVNFSPDDACVAKAAELAYSANTDLDVVTNVYNYMIQNVTYDTQLANTVESGYLPDPDRTLSSCTGICLDYACLMASMLRSQGIPTHMEVGYASTAYHAWISIYLKETGWVNGIIEFNGTSWELMDPTFAASASAAELQEFIGDGSNYDTKYIY
ncbi:MAG: lasso peptide biosynthesis protein [Lachnospiraceae bacterium]|nr:lasso peptide biosynthesis protein [Lachnospiraceae bacterium]